MRHFYCMVFSATLLIVASCTREATENELPCAPDLPEGMLSARGTRSYEEAVQFAEQGIAIVDHAATTRASSPRRIIDSQCVTREVTRGGEQTADTVMYVFNFADEAGFVVVSARSDLSPLIAVTEQGNYTYGEPTGVEPFDDYMASVSSVIVPKDPIIPPLDTLNGKPIFKTVEINELSQCEPLLKTKWGQEDIYGAYCPNGISGCVATAMAQIMAYHKYPASITTIYSGYPYADETIYFDWDKMLTHVKSSKIDNCGNSAYHYMISALMRQIGEEVFMSYADSGDSSALSSNVPRAFRALGYACGSGSTLFSASSIYQNLDQKYPVYICGTPLGAPMGHAWVIDGYYDYRHGTEFYSYNYNYKPGSFDPDAQFEYNLDSSTVVHERMLHFNWGYDGDCNGYFDLGVYKCNQGTEYDDPWANNGMDMDYSQSLFIISYIKPNNY